MTITEFLTARLDEDEAVAREALLHYQHVLGIRHTFTANQGTSVAMTPLVALAEVDAKRRIVEEYTKEHWVMEQGHRTEWTEGGQAARETVLRLLALPYADHPDYDERWKP